MDKFTALIIALGTLFAAWVGFQQYRLSKRQTFNESVAKQTRELANNNNNILESWKATAVELREELDQCRKEGAELRTRMSGLETKLAMYRNVAYRGWPLEIVEETPEESQPKEE